MENGIFQTTSTWVQEFLTFDWKLGFHKNRFRPQKRQAFGLLGNNLGATSQPERFGFMDCNQQWGLVLQICNSDLTLPRMMSLVVNMILSTFSLGVVLHTNYLDKTDVMRRSECQCNPLSQSMGIIINLIRL